MQKYLFCFLFPLLAAGCFSQTDKKMATSIAIPSLEPILQTATAAECTKSFSLGRQWWELFEDAQLNSLIEQALQENPTLQKAEAKVVAAQARAKMVRSNLFPHLTANAAENWLYLSKYGLFRDFFPQIPGFSIPHKLNETTFSLGFSYEVDFFGKNQKLLQAALGKALAEEMERRQAELILCISVAYTYFSLQSSKAQLMQYQEELVCEKALLDIANNRYKTGIDNITPSLADEQKIASLLQKIEEISKGIAIDTAFLQELLGIGSTPLSIEFVWNPIKIANYLPDNLPIDLLSQRPDLMAQSHRVEAARQEVGVAKTEFLPNINLMALGGFSSLSFSHLFEWASRAGGLRPAIHLPLFMGGQLQGNLTEKVAKFNEAVFDYNSLLLQATKEVVSQISTFVCLHEQIKEQEKKLFCQKRLYEIATLSYTVGTEGYDLPLSQKRALLMYEVEATSLYQYKILSFLKVIQALGGGWEETVCPM